MISKDELVNSIVLMAQSLGRCRLTKLQGGKAMRTHEIVGEMVTPPVVGQSFFMRAAVLDEAFQKDADAKGLPAGRVFNTSALVSIDLDEENKGLVLTTASGSKYYLESA